MPKSRVREIPQRPSPRAPTNIRVSSSSDSDPTNHRSRIERSPRLGDGRSPRVAHSEPVSQKKLGTRIAGLESQLGQAQVELKCLKDQLASAEAAKKAAQEQLDKKSWKTKKVPKNPVEIQEKQSNVDESLQGLNKKESSDEYEKSDDVLKETTDVYEVTVESKTEVNSCPDQDKSLTEKSALDESEVKSNEVDTLKNRLEVTEKEVEIFRLENEDMKIQLHDKSVKISSAETEIQELTLRLNKVNQELEKRKASEAQMRERLEATEKLKEELENEMKRLRVLTEQWRKAADAAASVLAGEVEMNERRISERCGSMEKKQHGFAFEPDYQSYVGSPGLIDDSNDVSGAGKKKGSGIRMFGDLWKRKGHK